MAFTRDVLAHILRGSNPDLSSEEIDQRVSAMERVGQGAIDQALGMFPGLKSAKDIVTNAPTVMPPAMAAGASGAPLSPTLPNPGNPLSGAVQGAIAPIVMPEAPMASQEPRGATRSWEPNPTTQTPETPVVERPSASQTPSMVPSQPATPSPLDAYMATAGKDSSEDQRRREAEMAALEHKRRMNVLPAALAGFGDAVVAGANTRGGSGSTDAMKGILASGDKAVESGKTAFEQTLRNDPNSDVSKQYQAMLAEITKKKMDDPLVMGMTANQIAEKLPNIEKLMQRLSDEEKQRFDMRIKERELASKGGPAAGETVGQKAVDKQFAKTYEDFIPSGGYAKAVGQLSSLVSLARRLDSGKENLTGPIKGRMPEFTRPTSVAAQQEVEQTIQEGLRATLGAQFTEKEGERFLARAYDPKLPEKLNADKIRKAAQTLQLMIRAKKQAADFYEENGTLTGYKGKLYTLKDGEMVEASPAQMESILSEPITGDKVPAKAPKSDPLGLF